MTKPQSLLLGLVFAFALGACAGNDAQTVAIHGETRCATSAVEHESIDRYGKKTDGSTPEAAIADFLGWKGRVSRAVVRDSFVRLRLTDDRGLITSYVDVVATGAGWAVSGIERCLDDSAG